MRRQTADSRCRTQSLTQNGPHGTANPPQIPAPEDPPDRKSVFSGSIDTELVNTVVDPEMQEVAKMLFSDKTKMLTADEMADAIVFAINEPENVLIRTLVVQPTKA